jgi:hypothetical protein
MTNKDLRTKVIFAHVVKYDHYPIVVFTDDLAGV